MDRIKKIERGLYKRNGTWCIDITYRDPKSGLKKRVRKAIGSSKEMARNELAGIRSRIAQGTYSISHN